MNITTYDELINDLIKEKITMVDYNSFKMVLHHYDNIDKIDGDIVECGCWRGGFSIFLSHVFVDKNIWACDSFKGFQPLNNAKYKYDGEVFTPEVYSIDIGAFPISLTSVQNNFTKYGLSTQDGRIKFVEGFVKDSLPTSGINKISLLRIDVDAFSATLEVLDELYDKVQPGGYIIFDDSCLYESLDAIKSFFKKRNLEEYILHPATGEKLDLNKTYTNDNSGFPSGCYCIKGVER